MISPTSERAELATPEYINKKIYEATMNSLSKIIQSSSEQRANVIEERLKELNHEWDIERLLEFNGSIVLFISLLLVYLYSYYFIFIIFALAIFLLIYAIHRWAPPIPVLRKILGMRTSVEILSEKATLKILRGDFHSINPVILFKQNQENSIEYSSKQLLNLADLHSYNDNKTKKQS